MSRRFKRLLAVLLSVVMTLSSNLMVFAANTTSAEDAIIAQAIGLNENFDVDEHDFSVISLEEIM